MCYLSNYLSAIKQKDFSKMTITYQENNKPNKKWIKTRFTFVVTFVALGVWVVINYLNNVVLD
jgi:hypothetical protein